MKQYIDTIRRLTFYNIKIIFGNKFIYFMLSAIAFYILRVVIGVFEDSEITEATAYDMLLFPSILLIFYPTCFGIQNDQDAKIIEIIFGIPNYRYKVWLFRLLITYVICFMMTLLLGFVTDWLVVTTDPFTQTIQVLVPAFLIGMMCFMFSTFIKSGSGTAVIMIVFGLIFLIMSNALQDSKWNIFLNPFDIPLDKNPQIYYTTLFNNRIILLVASCVFLLIALVKTQNREKFI